MNGVPPVMEPPDWGELGRIAANSFRQNPRVFSNAYTAQVGGGFEPTPIEDALNSPLLDWIRQRLPARVGDTPLRDALPDRTPEWVESIPLGGYSMERMDALREMHEINADVADRTYLRGKMPNPELGTIGDVPVGPGNRNKLAQLAGITASDLVGTQALQHIWWFLNAVPAISSIAQLQSIHHAGNEYDETGRWLKGKNRADENILTPLLKTRNMRMAAAAPAWIGINFATGAFGRQPGYTASVPSEQDPRIAVNPVVEGLSRLFLNREGRLLKYDEFVKERPDVSKGEYEAYKAYLFGNPSPIKATLDGIHGPEVNLLGKSVPLLTGILPAVAGVWGARRGARMAAQRLADDPRHGNLIEKRDHLFDEVRILKQASQDRGAEVKQQPGTKRTEISPEVQAAVNTAQMNRALAEYKEINNLVEGETLKQVLAWSGGSFTGAGLLGSTLEAIRRSLRGEAPPELDAVAPVDPTIAPPRPPLPAAPL